MKFKEFEKIGTSGGNSFFVAKEITSKTDVILWE